MLLRLSAPSHVTASPAPQIGRGALAAVLIVALAQPASGQCVAFGEDVPVATGGSDVVVVLADVNGDDELDLIAALADGFVSIALNQGGGTFGEPQLSSLIEAAPSSSVTGLQAGDLDGDRDIDVVAAGIGVPVQLLFNEGDGTFGAPVELEVQVFFPRLALGDLNGDDSLDIVATAPGFVLINNGDGTFQPPLSFAAAVLGSNVSIGDLNGDTINDLVVTNSSISPHLTILFIDPRKGLVPGPTVTTPNFPTSAAIADFDGDGDNDLAATIFPQDQVAVLLNQGGAVFAPAQLFGAGNGPQTVVTGDINGDGLVDLLVNNSFQGTSTLSVLLGLGDGTFGPDVMFGTNPGQPALGDLDGDGLPDLAFSTPTIESSTAVIFNQTCTAPAPSADLNGDGVVNGLDLAMLLSSWGPVR